MKNHKIIFSGFFLLTILFLSFNVFSQSNANRVVLEETIKKYKSHSAITYDVDFAIKFFDDEALNYVHSNVNIIKDKIDTIFNSKFSYGRVDTSINVIKYYNYPYLYVIDLTNKKIERSDASKGQIYDVTGNIDGDVLKSNFASVEKLEKKLNDPENNVTYLDTSNFLKITINYPDKDEIYGCEESIYIDKEKKIITKKSYQAKYKDQIQRNSWLFKNIVFDEIGESNLKSNMNKYLDSFPIEDYKPPTDEDYKLLDTGMLAPKISGTIFPNYEKVSALNFEKITLIDFWYTSCMPCINAIPHLNKLYKKYGNKIDVIGINPYEVSKKDSEKIYNFLRRTPIDYPIYLVDTIPSDYNIKAYPTLYIIDKKGLVRYSKIGLSENMYNELDEVISDLLKK